MSRPLVNRRRKGFLRGLFGEIEIPGQPDESRHDPAPVGAIDRVNSRVSIRETGI